jgi:hypothetical protein
MMLLERRSFVVGGHNEPVNGSSQYLEVFL